MAEAVHPFVPGAKVAMVIYHRWGASSWSEHEVEKLYANGRFTLKAFEGQWNAYAPNRGGEKHWHAHRAGNARYGSGTLLIWDEASDGEIRAGFATEMRAKKLSELQSRIERLTYKDVTETQLMTIEAALNGALG